MIRAVILGLIAVFTAAVVGSDALGRSLHKRLPQVAAGLPTANGFDLSAKASVVLTPGMKGGIAARIRLARAQKEEVARLSKAALRKEPLNDEALRNLALLAADSGRNADARRLMRASAEITKRDLTANMWLALDYAKLGDVDNSLAMYDQGLRSNSQAQELIIPAMARLLKSDQMVAPVARLLLRQPPWQADFWASAPRFAEAHGNLAKIRLVLAKRNVRIAPASNRELIRALASTGYFAQAEELVARFGGIRPRPPAALRNTEFDLQPEYPPFDWQPRFDASLTAELDSRIGVLRIAAFGDGSGPAASQLVALPHLAYRLEVRARDWTSAQSGQVYFKLRCAEQGVSAESQPIKLEQAQISVAIAKPSPGCLYNWLTVFAAPSQSRDDRTVLLDRVDLVAR